MYDAGCVQSAINTQRTADVAPRAEVDEWICRCREWHEVAELKSQRILELGAELSKVKAEIAEQIFAEIRQCWARRLFDCDDFSYKDFAFEDFAGDLDELYKKYTGEQT